MSRGALHDDVEGEALVKPNSIVMLTETADVVYSDILVDVPDGGKLLAVKFRQ